MRVAKFIILLLVAAIAEGQVQTKGDCFVSLIETSSDSILVSGVVLKKQDLLPIHDLPPIISFKKKRGANSTYQFNYEGVYDKKTGTFVFKLPKGEYKFLCTQVGYYEVYSEWLNLPGGELKLVFLIDKYEQEGFH